MLLNATNSLIPLLFSIANFIRVVIHRFRCNGAVVLSYNMDIQCISILYNIQCILYIINLFIILYTRYTTYTIGIRDILRII